MSQDDFKVLAFLANRLASVTTTEIEGFSTPSARAALERLERSGFVEKMSYRKGGVSLWRATKAGNIENFSRSTIGRNAELKG